MNNAANGEPSGLWLSVSELARTRGLAKSGVSARVSRLVGKGVITTRTGVKGTKLINVAEFDRAIGETGDLAHAQAPAQDDAPLLAAADPASETASAAYSREQAREKSYKAELARLDLEERLGKLVAVEKVAEAAGSVAEALVRAIDQFPTRAAEILSASESNGVEGIRTVLRSIGRDLRDLASRELVKLADVASKTPDPAPGDDQVVEDLD